VDTPPNTTMHGSQMPLQFSSGAEATRERAVGRVVLGVSTATVDVDMVSWNCWLESTPATTPKKAWNRSVGPDSNRPADDCTNGVASGRSWNHWLAARGQARARGRE
jgi:hypothetical protein